MPTQQNLELPDDDQRMMSLIRPNVNPAGLQALSWYVGSLCANDDRDRLDHVRRSLYAVSGGNVAVQGAFDALTWMLEGYFSKLPEDPRVVLITAEIAGRKVRGWWKDLLRFLEPRGFVGPAEIVAGSPSFSLSRETFNRHRRQMMQLGLLEERQGRKPHDAQYAITPLGRAVLRKLSGDPGLSRAKIELTVMFAPDADHRATMTEIGQLGAEPDPDTALDGEAVSVMVPAGEEAAWIPRLEALPGVARAYRPPTRSP